MSLKKKIIICICSRKFNKNLLNLLNSISRNVYSKKKVHLKVLIVINNAIKISSFQKTRIKKSLKNIIFVLLNEPNVGIVNARNKCLDFLKSENFDFGCYLDDDCFIKRDFLKNHLNFIKKNRCDIATGSQINISKKKFHRILERNFDHKEIISWASTNNVFFKKKIVKNDIIFSNKVTKYGFGEDQYYFSKISRKGFIIKWNKFANVFEIKKSNKENFHWFLNRNFKYGLTGVLIDIELYGIIKGVIINILKFGYNFALSLYYILLLPFAPKMNFYYSISFLMRSIGRVFGILNIN